MITTNNRLLENSSAQSITQAHMPNLSCFWRFVDAATSASANTKTALERLRMQNCTESWLLHSSLRVLASPCVFVASTPQASTDRASTLNRLKLLDLQWLFLLIGLKASSRHVTSRMTLQQICSAPQFFECVNSAPSSETTVQSGLLKRCLERLHASLHPGTLWAVILSGVNCDVAALLHTYHTQ